MIDAIAHETHFVDHLAPVWHALPELVRGRFIAGPAVAARARAKGLDVEVIPPDRTPPPPGPKLDGQPALVASIGDTKVGRRMGYGPFVRLEHGAGQAYKGDRSGSYAGGPGNEDAALVLVPNEYSAQLWRQSYPSARVEIVGSPRLDALPARGGDDSPVPVVALSFHWPAIGYKGTAFPDFRRSLETIARLYRVIGHEHPNWSARRYPGAPHETYAKLGIEFVPDFEDVCRRADLYVADNTSTLFEFAATGRPVVVLNARVWHRKGGDGLRFWDAAHVGVNVDPSDDVKVTVDRLVRAIDTALIDGPEQKAKREDALRIAYTHRTGAAQRAADAIVDWLKQRKTAAA